MDDPLDGGGGGGGARPAKRLKLSSPGNNAADPAARRRRVPGVHRWSGNHPEDCLVEPVIKSGYFDKGLPGTTVNAHGSTGSLGSTPGGSAGGAGGGASASTGIGGSASSTSTTTITTTASNGTPSSSSSTATDTNSGRAAVWPSLTGKNSTGTQMLSHIFTQALEKRLILGKSTAPSTFRPPPRVTVTDNKREAWLKDLASPAVPLRKQSRTIPHGIRGRALLEQCTAKVVPVHRALWLVRCVGANEMRAYRRKGLTGAMALANERRWVREWTVDVETFVGTVVQRCGQQPKHKQQQGKGWLAEMSYVCGFVAALFAENLLDTEHFLDWLVASYASSELRSLALWESLVRDYWTGVTAFGRRGRRLAEATVETLLRLGRVQSKSLQVGNLMARLRKILGDLQSLDLGCLVMIPTTWEKYTRIHTASKTTERRALGTSSSDSTEGRKDPAELMGLKSWNEGLPVGLTRRIGRLVGTASRRTMTRSSPSLLLFATLDSIDTKIDFEELESRCSQLIPDNDKLVFALFDWASTPYRIGSSRVYLAAQLIARILRRPDASEDLVRNYLRAAGSKPRSFSDNVHRVILELMRLEVLCTGHVLRWFLTTSMLHSVDNAGNEPDCAMSFLSALQAHSLPSSIVNARRAVLAKLGQNADEQSLIDVVLEAAEGKLAFKPEDSIKIPDAMSLSAKFSVGRALISKSRQLSSDSGMTLGAFISARGVLESTRDVAALAEVVEIAGETPDLALLAAAVDTITLHARAFAALGKTTALVESLAERFNTLRSQQTVPRPFIRAFADLLLRIPQLKHMKERVVQDETLGDLGTNYFGCSPASDSLVNMQGADLDSDEEIAAVFASGNIMDEQLMGRIFQRVIKRSSQPGPEPLSKETLWLNQLRAVDVRGFENLVQGLLREWVNGTSDSVVSTNAIATLVASGSVELSKVLELAGQCTDRKVTSEALRLLFMSQSFNPGLRDSERYRFRVQQELCKTVRSKACAPLIRIACDSTDCPEVSSELLDMLARWIVARPDCAAPIFWQSTRSDELRANAGRILSAFIGRSSGMDVKTISHGAAAVLPLATPLSLPFCVGLIRHIRATETRPDEKDSTFQSAIADMVTRHSDVSLQLLEFASDATKRRIHASLQDELLNVAPKKLLQSEWTTESDLQDDINRCLDVLVITSSTSETSEETAAIASIAEQVKDLTKELDSNGEDFWLPEKRACLASAKHRLSLLADLIVIYATAAASPSDNETGITSRLDLLAALCATLIHPILQTDRQATKTLVDAASILSDSLPRDALASVKRPEAGDSHPYIAPILGPSPFPPAWLALTSSAAVAAAAAAGSVQGESQQRRALNRRLPPPTPGGGGGARPASAAAAVAEKRMTPFPSRPWETLSDSSPMMGENDTSVGLPLFGARRV